MTAQHDRIGNGQVRIESLELENYRVFRRAKLADIPKLAVIVGANGSGKSTLIDVFAFLKDALVHNVETAAARRGGFLDLVSRGSGGPICITVHFRESGGRLATYRLRIVERGGRAVVDREVLGYRRGRHSKAWPFVDFARGEGSAITNELADGQKVVREGREEYKLNDPSDLAIKGLGQFQRFRVAAELRSLIEKWHVSDFQVSAARPVVKRGYAKHLSPTGDNLAHVVRYLRKEHADRFAEVLQAMKAHVPGVTDVDVVDIGVRWLALRFHDKAFEDPFPADFVSDGTIKMFAYLVLLYDPKPHPLLAVEEPENHLYPEHMLALIEEFRDYARRGGQTFVSTHSTEFVDGADLQEVFWLAKENGFTTVRRASSDDVLRSLVAGGEKLGMLWWQGLFNGASGR